MATIRPHSQLGKDLIPGISSSSKFKALQRQYLLHERKSSRFFTTKASTLKNKLEEAAATLCMTAVFAGVMIMPDAEPRAPPAISANVAQYLQKEPSANSQDTDTAEDASQRRGVKPRKP